MVTIVTGHLFHYTTKIAKEPSSDRQDAFDWDNLVWQVDSWAEVSGGETYNADLSVGAIICDCAAGTPGNIVINLPQASVAKGHTYKIIKIDSGAETVTIDPFGSEQVGGAANLVLASQHQGASIKATTSAWYNFSAAGSGETNVGANVGTGEGLIYRGKTGVTLDFKKLQQGSGIVITNNANEIIIALAGGGTDVLTNVFEGGVQVGSTGLAPDFDGTDFNVAESAGKAVISLNYGTGAGQPAEGNHAHAIQALSNTSGATGDIWYWNGTAITRLAIGTNNQVLKSNGTTVVWGTDQTGGGTGQTTGFRNPDDDGATHNGTANDATKINTAINTIVGGKTVLTGGYEYGVSAPIILNDNYCLFDGQHGVLKCLSGHTSNSTGGIVELDAGSGDLQGSRLYLKLKDLIIDFNNQATHPHGIHCNIYTGSGSPPASLARDKIFKGLRIDGITFLNHNDAGKSLMKLRNLENGCFIRGIHAEGVASTNGDRTIGIDYADEGYYDIGGPDEAKSNHGNSVFQEIFISPAGGAVGFTGMKIQANQFGFLNRVQVHDAQFFCYQADTADKSVALWLDIASDGGVADNRLWEFYGLKCEDWTKSVKLTRSALSAGVWGVNFYGGLLEDKEDFATDLSVGGADTGGDPELERTLIDIGPGWQVNCYGMNFMNNNTTNGGDSTGINVASSTENCYFVNCKFLKKGGGTAVWNKFHGLHGKDNIFIKDCDGYNPVGIITNPWTGAGTSGGLYNVSATSTPQAFPKSASVYTVRQTAKHISIFGGVVSQIQINGQTITGATSFDGVLAPGETIKVTHTSNPSGVVYCL